MSRRLFGRAVLGGTAAVGTIGISAGTADASRPRSTTPVTTVPFRGVHQAGILTPAQGRVLFAAFDVVTTDPAALTALLTTWTAASELMTQGALVDSPTPGADADSPWDTGEAVGDTAGLLTITIGYGATLFQKFGWVRQPAQLLPLPAFTGDALDPTTSDGDLAIQACGDDPQVNFHAIRNLARLGTGVVKIRWIQTGFGRTSSTSPAQNTPRNLMGFKDGTRNIVSTEDAAVNDYVWADKSALQDWMVGGSYLVVRKIRMDLVKWDADGLDDQEDTFGRHKRSGAPFTGTKEFDTPDFAATNSDGTPVIPASAHIRLAAHETNGGIRILRRGYSYTDGEIDGVLDSGLFFLAYMKDPAQFVALQSRLAAGDDLNEYVTHQSSALFAVPRGLLAGQDWGTQLFG